MAMNKKKSRPIHIDGYDFRWMVRENSGWNDVTLQNAAGDGQKLVVQLAWGPDGMPEATTPVQIRWLAQQATQLSWRPNDAGPTLRLDMAATRLSPVGA